MIELILINNNIPLLPYDTPFSLIMHLILHSITRALPLHVKKCENNFSSSETSFVNFFNAGK